MTAEPVIEQVHPDRVRLVFEQADGAVKETRVPAGTHASRNTRPHSV